jgi:hypothetical protein
LQGIRPADILTPSAFKYGLEERAAVARLLFMPLNGLDEDQIIQVRFELVENLVRLCKRQETPHQYKAPKSRGRLKTRHLDGSTDAEDSDDADISQEEAGGTDMEWDAKTLVDDESDADSMTAMEFEEPPKVPELFCAFCKWGDEEAGTRKRKHYSPVLTVSAGTSEFNTFTLGLPVRALSVLTKDAQPFWGVRCTS